MDIVGAGSDVYFCPENGAIDVYRVGGLRRHAIQHFDDVCSNIAGTSIFHCFNISSTYLQPLRPLSPVHVSSVSLSLSIPPLPPIHSMGVLDVWYNCLAGANGAFGADMGGWPAMALATSLASGEIYEA